MSSSGSRDLGDIVPIDKGDAIVFAASVHDGVQQFSVNHDSPSSSFLEPTPHSLRTFKVAVAATATFKAELQGVAVAGTMTVDLQAMRGVCGFLKRKVFCHGAKKMAKRAKRMRRGKERKSLCKTAA